MRISRNAETIRKNKNFRKVLSASRRSDGLMTVAAALGTGRANRFGVSVSKKVDKRAVRRNLIKRRLKAAFAACMAEAPREGLTDAVVDAVVIDVVVITKPEAANAGYADLARSLAYLLSKQKLGKRRV